VSQTSTIYILIKVNTSTA